MTEWLSENACSLNSSQGRNGGVSIGCNIKVHSFKYYVPLHVSPPQPQSLFGKIVFYYVWLTQLSNNLLDEDILLPHHHLWLLVQIFVVFFNSFVQEICCQIFGVHIRAFQQLAILPEVKQCYISKDLVIASQCIYTDSRGQSSCP